jgi:hypothetical protein
MMDAMLTDIGAINSNLGSFLGVSLKSIKLLYRAFRLTDSPFHSC